MIDWRRYLTKRNLILTIPWIYLVVYAFAVRGMSVVYNGVMDGSTVIDPVYTNSQLTIMLSFWVVFAMILCGYILVRYACRLAVGETASQRIDRLERRIEELEGKGQ